MLFELLWCSSEHSFKFQLADLSRTCVLVRWEVLHQQLILCNFSSDVMCQHFHDYVTKERYNHPVLRLAASSIGLTPVLASIGLCLHCRSAVVSILSTRGRKVNRSCDWCTGLGQGPSSALFRPCQSVISHQTVLWGMRQTPFWWDNFTRQSLSHPRQSIISWCTSYTSR